MCHYNKPILTVVRILAYISTNYWYIEYYNNNTLVEFDVVIGIMHLRNYCKLIQLLSNSEYFCM